MKIKIFLLSLVIPVLLNATIYILQIEGPIDSITEEYIKHSFNKIQNDSTSHLIIIQLDTPGGLDTSMRSIIKEILNSRIPIVVYVQPRGARAASAGFFITLAADIAAMAPGTNMGAAHPVAITGTDIENTMKQKVTNDAASYIRTLARNRNRSEELAEAAVTKSNSYTAEECMQNGLCDYIANNLTELLDKLKNTTIRRIDGKTITFKLNNENIKIIGMTNRQKFLKTITNPNLAYFLLIIGLAGLYIEFTHPGVIIPGVLGGISLLLAFLSFQVLPINYVGLALILLAIGLLVAEIKIQSFGLLGIGGVASFVLGSIVLFNSPIPEMKPAISVITTLAILITATILFLSYKVIQSGKKKPEGGKEGLLEEIGSARTDITSEGGKVFIHGEWWNAISDEFIAKGNPVKIIEINSMIIKVKKEGGQ